MNREKNRTKRRDKKITKKKGGMRVDYSARSLARIKKRIIEDAQVEVLLSTADLEKLHNDLLTRGENNAWFVPKQLSNVGLVGDGDHSDRRGNG